MGCVFSAAVSPVYPVHSCLSLLPALCSVPCNLSVPVLSLSCSDGSSLAGVFCPILLQPVSNLGFFDLVDRLKARADPSARRPGSRNRHAVKCFLDATCLVCCLCLFVRYFGLDSIQGRRGRGGRSPRVKHRLGTGHPFLGNVPTPVASDS